MTVSRFQAWHNWVVKHGKRFLNEAEIDRLAKKARFGDDEVNIENALFRREQGLPALV